MKPRGAPTAPEIRELCAELLRQHQQRAAAFGARSGPGVVRVRREWPVRPFPQQEASERLWPTDGRLLDAGPLVALFDRSDKYHRWAVAQWARAPVPLLTCEAVLGEATHLLCEHAGLAGDKVLALFERKVIAALFRLEEHAGPWLICWRDTS